MITYVDISGMLPPGFIAIPLFLFLAFFLGLAFYTRKILWGKSTIGSLRTDIWTAFFVLLVGCVPGMLAERAAFLLSRQMHREWNHTLSLLAFIVVWVFFAKYLWNNATRHVRVEPTFVGVILVFGLRLRTRWLQEGDYRLLPLFEVKSVDMKRIPGKTLDFTEISLDRLLITIKGFRIGKVRDPDNFLDNANADDVLDGVFEAAARTYVRSQSTEELMKPDARNGLTLAIKKELVKYDEELDRSAQGGDDRSFADRDAIEVKIEKLEPPAGVMKAAEDRASAVQVQLRKMVELDGLVGRLEKFLQTNTGLSPLDAAIMFQRNEGLVKAEEFIIRGLEELAKAGAPTGQTLEALAQMLRKTTGGKT